MRMSVSRSISLAVILAASLAILLLPGAEVAQAQSVPTITSVAITSTPTIDSDQDGTVDTYGVGENIELTVTWNEDVRWDISASGASIIGCIQVVSNRNASLVTGGATSGTAGSLVFRHVVHSGRHGLERRRRMPSRFRYPVIGALEQWGDDQEH